ncbi:hypothetical protein G6F56_006386 [Rhizopus delemar]|nr:hypothetical protein G6F56_006386 [Rhizopus delemar]
MQRSERRAIHREQTKKLKKQEKKMAKNGANSGKFNSKKSMKMSFPLEYRKSKESVASTKAPSLRTTDACTLEFIQLTPDYSNNLQDEVYSSDIVPWVFFEVPSAPKDVIENTKKAESPLFEEYSKDIHTTADTKRNDASPLVTSPSFTHDLQDQSDLSHIVTIFPVAEIQGLKCTNKADNDDRAIQNTIAQDENSGSKKGTVETTIIPDTPDHSFWTNPIPTDSIFQARVEPGTDDVMINAVTVTNSGSSELKDETKQLDETCGDLTEDIFYSESSSTSTESVIDQFIQPNKLSVYPTPSTSFSIDSWHSLKKKSNVFSRVFRREPKKASRQQ